MVKSTQVPALFLPKVAEEKPKNTPKPKAKVPKVYRKNDKKTAALLQY
jgi:hypothetical protein